MKSSDLPPTLSQLRSILVTEHDTLSKLNPNKAMGHDNISPKLLKMCAVPFTPPLTALSNASLSSASIPSAVYKSGDYSLVTNYRPISLLCSISNVLEC